MRILVAEDEKDLNNILVQKLTSEGYSIDSCFDGQEAIELIDAVEYDIIILDIMMPKVDGYGVLTHIRNLGKTTPVLFLTAKDSISDRVKGLDSGANDYLVKPFSLLELCARIRSLTRNSFGVTSKILTADDLSVDCTSHTVKRGEKTINLSSKEYALLEYLMLNKGILLTRKKIEDHIWNLDYEGGTNVVDVYISYLRKKIDEGHDVKLIHTIHGQGYILKEGKTI